MQTLSPQLKITQAYIYFSQPLSGTLNQGEFEQNLIAVSNCLLLKSMPKKMMAILINRYHQLISSLDIASIEEYLMIKFVQTLQLFIEKGGATTSCNQEILIIALWSAISHLKKTINPPQQQNFVRSRKDSREIIQAVLSLIQISIAALRQYESFEMQKIYPQVSAAMMNLVLEPIDLPTFRTAVQVMQQLLETTFSKITWKQELPNALLAMDIKSSGHRMKVQANKEGPDRQSDRFKEQFVLRFSVYFEVLIKKAPNLQGAYNKILLEFLEYTKLIFTKFNKLLVPFYMAWVIVGGSCDELLTQQTDAILTKSDIRIIRSAMTEQWISMASVSSHSLAPGAVSEPKTHLLKRLLAFSPFVDLSSSGKCDSMSQLLVNKMFLFHNDRNLVVPHHSIVSVTHLPELQAEHSFSSYPNYGGILSQFQFECNRVLVNKLPYAQMNLQNIELMSTIIGHFSNQTIDALLEQLLERMSDEETMVDTSLTKFCQFLTKVIVIDNLLHKGNHGRYQAKDISIVQSTFDLLMNTQAIRILEPSFKEEELLIGYVLLICYHCYLQLVGRGTGLSAISRLKYKLVILEITLNNSFEASYLLKLVTYHILLKQAAPQDIQSMLSNLQTVLINRNIRHLKFLIALIQLSKNNLTENECENLAQRFINSRVENSEELLRVLLNRLSQNTIRKCLLSAGASNGKWVYMLSNNTKLLYNRPIEQRERVEETSNFYMNDGPNVTISNALGVTVLELADKWEHGLLSECPYKETTLDLLLQVIGIGPIMVFFKARFSSIVVLLFDLLRRGTNEGGNWPRIIHKIYMLLDLVPAANFRLYTEQQVKMPASEKEFRTFRSCASKDFHDILPVMQKLLKQAQVEYLTTLCPATNQVCQLRERVYNKMEASLSP